MLAINNVYFHINPNPSALLIANMSFYLIFSLLLYSGISKWLKQVWELGSISLSSPWRPTYSLTDPSPFIGARSLPVVKAKNFFLCSSVRSSWIISQSHFAWGLSAVYPSIKRQFFSHALKSNIREPQINCSNSYGLKS